ALGGYEKTLWHAQPAHRVRGHGADAIGGQAAQALAEAGEAGERLVQTCLVEAAVGLEARGEAHAVAQAVDDARLTMLITRNDEVEAIGPEVDGGHQVAFADRGVVSVGHPRFPLPY